MERRDVKEFHFIAHARNVASIVEQGILSHRLAGIVDHVSVADEDVQAGRAAKVVNGRPLHDYANLYFDARNPMLSKRRGQNRDLAIIRVSSDALDLPGAVIADGNARSEATDFFASPGGLGELDAQYVFARYWVDQAGYSHPEWKRRRCAELLVPGRVPPDLIVGVYVAMNANPLIRTSAATLPIKVNGDLYF